jgi:hypothetical protein
MGQLQLLATNLYVTYIAAVSDDSLFSRLFGDLTNWRRNKKLLATALENTKTYFSNPRRYSREVVTIIAAIILSLLVVALLVMVFLSIKRQYAIRRAAKRVRRKLSKEEITRRTVTTCSILGIILILLTVGTAQPSLCARCHETQKSVSEWETSSHKTVGCLSCHYEPGLIGYALGTTNGVSNMLTHFIDANPPVQGAVTNSSCLRCHDDIFNRIVVDEREIRVRHKDLITGGLACTSCHAQVAHKTETGDTFAMNICVGCHTNTSKTASSKCSTCHQQDIAYKPGRTLDDWPKQKGLGVTCTGCHKQATTASCVRCHGLELPHSAEFRKKHAMRAAETKGELCFKCHWNSKMSQRRMCGCHDAQGEIHPAPEIWYYQHQSEARINGISCNCHATTFCARCHDDAKAVYPKGSTGDDQMHGGWQTGF